MDKKIDKNDQFRSFWRSISIKTINLNREGITIDQIDQDRSKDDRKRSSNKIRQDDTYSKIYSEKQRSKGNRSLLRFNQRRTNNDKLFPSTKKLGGMQGRPEQHNKAQKDLLSHRGEVKRNSPDSPINKITEVKRNEKTSSNKFLNQAISRFS